MLPFPPPLPLQAATLRQLTSNPGTFDKLSAPTMFDDNVSPHTQLMGSAAAAEATTSVVQLAPGELMAELRRLPNSTYTPQDEVPWQTLVAVLRSKATLDGQQLARITSFRKGTKGKGVNIKNRTCLVASATGLRVSQWPVACGLKQSTGLALGYSSQFVLGICSISYCGFINHSLSSTHPLYRLVCCCGLCRRQC